MELIHLDPVTYAALAAHKDHLSRIRQREATFDEALVDLLDHFRSGPGPTMPNDPEQQAADHATAAPGDGHRQPPP